MRVCCLCGISKSSICTSNGKTIVRSSEASVKISIVLDLASSVLA